MSGARDKGFALLVAVAGIAAFAYVAFEAMADGRGIVAGALGDAERAKLSAAADAGLMLAIHGLAGSTAGGGWPINGSVQTMAFGGVVLSIAVQDERGKVPINDLDEPQVRGLFAAAGASGAQLDTLTDSFNDWLDEDDDRRPNGAEAPDYAAVGIHPRNGEFRTVDELSMLKGMDPYLFAKLAPVVTVNFGESGAFDPATASPLAIQAMAAEGVPADDEQNQVNPQTPPAMPDPAADNLAGRRLTVRVTAQDAAGTITRSSIVELTGNPADPYWIRVRN